MAEQNQIIVEPVIETGKAKGSRNQVNLDSCFPASPIYMAIYSDEERKKEYLKRALSGNVLNGNGLNRFNRDFEDAPNLEDVDITNDEVLGEKLPSPYMPNLASPGPGNFSAANKPEYTGEVPDQDFNIEFGSGKGGTVSPSETSKEISSHDFTLSSYISGRSYAGSDGKA